VLLLQILCVIVKKYFDLWPLTKVYACLPGLFIWLYGSETRTLIAADPRRLEVFHNGCQSPNSCLTRSWRDDVTNKVVADTTRSVFCHRGGLANDLPAHRHWFQREKKVKTYICIAPHSKELTAETLRYKSHRFHTANTPHLPLPSLSPEGATETSPLFPSPLPSPLLSFFPPSPFPLPPPILSLTALSSFFPGSTH